MTEPSKRPETLDQKVARYINLAMVIVLGLALGGFLIWDLAYRFSGALAYVTGQAGAKSDDALWFLQGAGLLLLLVSLALPRVRKP